MKEALAFANRRLRDAAVLSHDKADSALGASQHVDETVNTEKLDLAADKVADSGLRDAEQPCCLHLRQPSLLDQLMSTHHQHCANPQVCPLLGIETNILEDIPARTLQLRHHCA